MKYPQVENVFETVWFNMKVIEKSAEMYRKRKTTLEHALATIGVCITRVQSLDAKKEVKP